jgi:hypothetical protein
MSGVDGAMKRWSNEVSGASVILEFLFEIHDALINEEEEPSLRSKCSLSNAFRASRVALMLNFEFSWSSWGEGDPPLASKCTWTRLHKREA